MAKTNRLYTMSISNIQHLVGYWIFAVLL